MEEKKKSLDHELLESKGGLYLYIYIFTSQISVFALGEMLHKYL